jgi:hypothetical protein
MVDAFRAFLGRRVYRTECASGTAGVGDRGERVIETLAYGLRGAPLMARADDRYLTDVRLGIRLVLTERA